MEQNNPNLKDEFLLQYLTSEQCLDEHGELSLYQATSGQEASQSSEGQVQVHDPNVPVPVLNIDDLQITGIHPDSGLEVIEIQALPPLESGVTEGHVVITSGGVVQSVATGTTGSNDVTPQGTTESHVISQQGATDTAEVDDDDVIFVDREYTLKYLTGEITFEEYSEHLDVKDEPGLEEITETVIGSSDPQPGTSTESDKPSDGTSTAKVRAKPVRKPKLSRELFGLMGEANMRYARGKTEEAVKMCMEIIRQAPTAAEPFQTLSMIYEEQGDSKKSLQYALIGVHLKGDVDEWTRVADMCLEQNEINQAIRCYTKAIAVEPKNASLYWKRCELQERVGDKKLALNGYQTILSILPDSDAEKYLHLAKDLAMNFHASGDVEKGLEIMLKAVAKHPKNLNADDINLLLELFITQKNYASCLSVLVQHCGVVLIFHDDKRIASQEDGQLPDIPNDLGELASVETPEEFPVDLRAKLGTSLILLNYKKCVSSLLEPLLLLSADEVGDLHLDVAEAYSTMGNYRRARPILASLVMSENYSMAGVWLKYAETLSSLGDLEGAVQAYQHVVDLAPTHSGARMSMASIQQQLGQHEEALAALEMAPSSSDFESQEDIPRPQVDAKLLLHKCSLLYSQDKIPDFIDCAQELLFGHIKQAYRKEVFRSIISCRSTKGRKSNLKFMLGPTFDIQLQAVRELVNEGAVKLEDLWELFLKLCHTLLDKKMYAKFEDVTVLAQILPPFYSDTNIHQDLEFMCLIACILNHNGEYAYSYVRDLCLDNLEKNSVWNLFNQVVTIAKDLRHNRFCLRLMMKHPDNHVLGILNGHNAMIAGTYKHALGEYVAALKQDPQDPMLSLCVGITFIHLASQKFAARRNSLIVQGCSFLNQYLELRGDCQESNYNLGRAMHQMGLLHAAVHYYQRALSLPAAVTDTADNKEIFDLSRETAFNLSLIYQASGSHDLACHVINEHFII